MLRDGQRQGFIGPGDLEGHVSHSLAFVEIVDRLSRDLEGLPEPVLVDLGTGGGLPGLVLARSLPHWRTVLVEGSTRRGAWLESAISALSLEARVSLLVRRAEDVGRQGDSRGVASVVTARAFGPPPVVAECAAPLLCVGGTLVVSEPPMDPSRSDSLTQRWPQGPLATLGLDSAVPIDVAGRAFVTIRSLEACPERYPRRAGIPAKRPLWAVSGSE